MRFKPETFGTLVRPRILATGAIVPTDAKADLSNAFKDRLARPDPLQIFSKRPEELFRGLELGDTSQEDLSMCYTGEVTHYVVRVAGSLALVDKNNVQEALKKLRKRLGARANLRVVSVGLRFYQGMEKSPGGLRGINPWSPKTPEGCEAIWFFNPWELVPISEIMKYESVKTGDLILFQKTKGMVVKKKWLNKPRYYATSSWSCYSITLLNHTADGYTRFLPDRYFTVRRASDPEELGGFLIPVP